MEPLKYIRVHDIEACNERYAEGYKVHSVIVTHQQIGNKNPRSHISYLMSLSTKNAYVDAELVKDVRTDTEANHFLNQGYIIADTWKDKIRLVKKREAESD